MIPWSEYLRGLNRIAGYRRRDATARHAAYGRSTEADNYAVTVTLDAEIPDAMDVKFVA
jgi:hypothetical protein